MVIRVNTTINEVHHELHVRPDETAVETIRERVGLTGTKLVCDGGVCGSCTVLKNGKPVVTCLLPATSLDGSKIETVEGISSETLQLVQKALAQEDALQCGYCTPGYVVAVSHFVNTWRAEHPERAPNRTEIATALAGHLCRCGAYAAIFRAVEAVCGQAVRSTQFPWGSRIGAEAKITGRAIYTTDYPSADLLHAVVVRSTVASGTLISVDFDAATAMSGVRGAVLLESTGATIRWLGQPIAAIAADDARTARIAAAAVSVEIAAQLPVITTEQARAPGAPRVYKRFWQKWQAPRSTPWPAFPALWWRNLHIQIPVCLFGLLAVFRLAMARHRQDPHLYEATFETATQVHTSFEPHSSVAKWTDGALEVWVSTQAVDKLAHALAKRFSLPEENVTVNATYVGGGFGSKLEMDTETVAAVMLAQQTNRTVSLVLDRRQELSFTGSRAATRTEVAILPRSDGRLAASSFKSESNGGISTGSTVAALNLLMYSRSPRRSQDLDIITNAQASTQMRAPCGPPAAFALESAIDGVACRIKQDPLALRQQLDGNQKRQALYKWIAESEMWARRNRSSRQHGRIRHGVGVASSNWFYFVDPDTEVTVEVRSGTLVATVAAQDIGQGSATVIARTVARCFGIHEHEVEVRIGRSQKRHGPSSSGSRTTVSIGPTAKEAAEKLKVKIGGVISRANDGASATARRGGDRGIRAMPITIDHLQIGWGFTAAVHAVELEVDTCTGHVRILDVMCGIAAGCLYAPDQARRQVEGGIIQGIGAALYEGVHLDPHSGITLTSNLQDYRIPQLGDTPEISIHFHEAGWPRVPGGGVGLSEVSTIGVSAAVANAIFNATGWQPTSLPIRPDRILEGCGED